MEPPHGFIVSDDLGIKCHLRKAIYGLKQAGRAWQELVKKRLLSMGFKVSQADKCLYLKGNPFVLFYVDDGLIASATIAGYSEVIDMLKEYWSIRVLGEPKVFLGREIVRDHKLTR
jgi:hypothetical protein